MLTNSRERDLAGESSVFEAFDHGFLVADADRRPVVVNDAARRFVARPPARGIVGDPLPRWLRLSKAASGQAESSDPLDDVILGASSCGPELVAVEDEHGLRHVMQVKVLEDYEQEHGERLVKATMVKNLHTTSDDQMSPLFTAVFEEAPVAMGLAEVGPTGSASIVRVNAAYTRLLGYSQEELLGRGGDLLHLDDAPAVDAARRDLAHGKLGRHVTEVRVLRSDGSYFWGRMSRATVGDRPGQVRYVLSILENITEQKTREHAMGVRASTDPLTGLLNRAGLTEVLSSRLGTSSDEQIAVALIDLDNFKTVNDELGHARGDDVLVNVARGLKAAVRPEDAVARWGGDEFVIVASVASAYEGEQLGGRIAEHVRSELKELNRTVLRPDRPCGGSVGLVVARSGETPDGVLERADQAMYAVKHGHAANTDRRPRSPRNAIESPGAVEVRTTVNVLPES